MFAPFMLLFAPIRMLRDHIRLNADFSERKPSKSLLRALLTVRCLRRRVTQ